MENTFTYIPPHQYCHRCGQPMEKGVKTCPVCGTRRPKKGTVKTIFLVLISCLLALSLVVCGISIATNVGLGISNAELSSSSNYYQQQYQVYYGRWTSVQDKLEFFDDYVVFVEDDDTDYYHKYDCSNFAGESFWAFNLAAAEDDYYPCPQCID